MTIITDAQSGTIIALGELKEFWPNGYPIITDSNGNSIAYPPDFTIMYENVEVPSDVTPEKYCYTPEDGFYLNPDYREPENNPYGIPDELYDTIRDEAVAQIEREVAGDADK